MASVGSIPKRSSSAEKAGFRTYMPITFLIGFGFFTMGMMDPLYDSYVQIFLSTYIPYKSIVGAIMSLDNLLALFLIPLVSVWSDHTNTRLGRRMPWILVLLPLSAITFGCIPYAAQMSLAALVILLVFLNLFKQSVRGPVVALMPDIVPGHYRSQANGVINTMGNIAAIVGTLFLARLMDVDTVLPLLGATKNRLAFPAGAAFVLLATVALFLFVRERKDREPGEELAKVPFFTSISMVFKAKDKSAFLVLLSLFFWFVGYQGVVPYLTEFSIKSFNLSVGQGPLAMGMVGISSALAAIPMGYAASRWGRKRVIRISLVAIALLTLCVFFLDPVGRSMGMDVSSMKIVFWALMFGFGVFWICVVANSFPMLWQMAHFSNIGVYTGLYYTFSQLAAIVAPACSGAIIDLAGYRSMFVFCSVFFLLACFTMGLVTSGEKDDKPVEV
ncbi:MAG: MFS transporter [Spirochaetales bacterium]|nr:MFS transporter [Spirochaetales bacterium]